MAHCFCELVVVRGDRRDSVAGRSGQEASSSEVVGHRPDRVEPRVNKRRPKVLALMTKPR